MSQENDAFAKHLERLAELDAEGIQALFEAAADYHQKHCTVRAGATVICVCQRGGGQSAACRGLSVLQDFFRYANLDSEKWRTRFEQIQQMMM